jgi:hypothetical protein
MKNYSSQNSSISKYLWVLLFLFTTTVSLAQEANKTIRGKVTDDVTKQPIVGAVVTIKNSDPLKGTTTDANGAFKLTGISVGRVTLEITFLGYEKLTIPDIVVTAGKEVVLDLAITESITSTADVVVTYNRKEDPTVTINEMALVSARSFNPDDTKKYAGALGDPSRMAANFAGVVAGNDSRNDIVVRGNTPNAMLWQLEGINIPNPNHFGAGTSTGGPVSMLNANNIAKSDFFTSAFPAQYGNANGGVFDLRLRDGNNEKREFLGQVGFNGFEFGAEGPFSKNSKASYVVNYRYSTLGLLRNIGLDPGTGAATPLYQDLNFKVVVPTGNNGKFTAFGLGGFSSIDLLGKDVDTTETNYFGAIDENTRPRYRSGIIGTSYERNLSAKTWAKLSLAASHSGNNYTRDSINLLTKAERLAGKGNFFDNKYSIVFAGTHKVSTRLSLGFGANTDFTYFGYKNTDFFSNNIDSVRVDRADNFTLSQGYIQGKYRVNERITLSGGIHSQYFSFNEKATLEPRLGVRFLVGKTGSINLGYGLHNQTLNTYNLLTRNAAGVETNKQLDFLRSNHFVAGYERMLTSTTKLKVETYYQLLDRIPVNTYPSSFSAVNIGATFNPSDEADLTSKGTGFNYGVELTLERYFNNGFYYLLTGSLFDSKYKGSDGIERNTAFNTNYAGNLLAGKEFKVGKKGNVFYTNIKVTTIGGRYFTPLDLAASARRQQAIADESRPFSEKQDAYFRADIKVGYRKEFAKSTLEIALDIQNVTGNQNIFQEGYNKRTNAITYEYQQGFFPVPMVRYTF